MVLQAVEVFQITKHSKSFIPVISSTCCVQFTVRWSSLCSSFPCSNSLVAGVQMVLKVIWILTKQVMDSDHCKMFPVSRRPYHSLTP